MWSRAGQGAGCRRIEFQRAKGPWGSVTFRFYGEETEASEMKGLAPSSVDTELGLESFLCSRVRSFTNTRVAPLGARRGPRPWVSVS